MLAEVEPSPATKVGHLAAELSPYHIRFEQRHDSRAIFAYVYLIMTLDLQQELERQPEQFVDPNWVADLALAFGSRYMAAMKHLDEISRVAEQDKTTSPGRKAPLVADDPWLSVYIVQKSRKATVIEDLIYSMTAHISFDLPMALMAINAEPKRIADYHQMNEVLTRQTKNIARIVSRRYQPVLWIFHAFFAPFDDYFSNFGIRVARGLAWYNVDRLQDPIANPEALKSIQRSTAELIDQVRNQKLWIMRLGADSLRLLLSVGRRWPSGE